MEFLERTQDFSEITLKISKLINNNTTLKDLKKQKFSPNQHELFYLDKAPENLYVPYLLFRNKFRMLTEGKIITDFPLYLLIEPTSICNLRCVMCFQTDKSFGAEKKFMGRMDMELFKKIIDQAEEGGTKAITLASRGDPSLNKDLPQMLKYMKGKFLEVKLNTNGILLSEELSWSILENEVTDLVFSIDSYERENYEKIRKKAKFDKVLENIKSFMKLRETHFPEHRTTVRISGVKVDENQNRDLFNSFWNKIVDHCVLVDLEERWDTYNNSLWPEDKLLTCGVLFERMYIWWDGSVNPCDVDYKSTLAIGNVKLQSIKELWNGPRYTEIRNDHKNGFRSNYDVCSRCDSFTS